jgi:hypothetical protein
MARDVQGTVIEYRPVAEEENDQSSSGCDARADNSGIWNTCKAWYLVAVHLAACVILLVCLAKAVDEQVFQTGSPPYIFVLPLYQAQVTGLISFSLVLIRILGSACSTLLVWRTIFIMLKQESVSLVELVRLDTLRLPMVSRGSSKNGLFWSCWAALVTILLWPSLFASPLATSAVTWIPSTKLSSQQIEIPTKLIDGSIDWYELLAYTEKRSKTLIAAVSMAGKDPAYLFNSTGGASSKILLIRRRNSGQQRDGYHCALFPC